MTSAPPTDSASAVPASTSEAVRLAVRLAAVMLAAGAQTDDVEEAIALVCVSYGVTGVEYAVSFSSISVSLDEPGARRPTTIVRIVRARKNNFAKLAAAATFLDAVHEGKMALEDAPTAVADLERQNWSYPRVVEYLAPPLSATGSTLVFGGSPLDALATLVIALAVQPVLARLDRSQLPPFFRAVFGAALSTLLVALFVGFGLPIEGGLVLTGSLLGLLPGYALMSGFRDLIDQSIVSGTARLAEAFLLGAGVAGGTALAIALAENAGVKLSLVRVGTVDWSSTISILAAVLAVGAFAVRLGVPWRYVWQTAVLGAFAWVVYIAVAGGERTIQSSLATFAAALLVGICGRLLARRQHAPPALWVVPAILPLLPGLQIVVALLAATDVERITGMVAAAATAFTLGVGVGMGDIIVASVLSVRDKVVAPAVGVVADGVDDFIVAPVGRVVGHSRAPHPRDTGSS
jgi:uncharacterized membrane protein YjjP (DUF1212 family)